jgi:ubiquinone/menaquinone biosynthesis C-methylase UbiE
VEEENKMITDVVTPDLVAIKGRQQQAWTSGDYGIVGITLVGMSESLCEALDLRSGQRVLDVASGNGNTALAAARRFCEVVGTDYAPNLLEQARTRAAAERLTVDFQEGDAENLPFPDESFDAVLSTLGAMFAPDQEKTASELTRVCRSGGKIGMANWTPDGFVGQMFRVIGQHVPPPAGLKPPMLWGTEARLHDLFGDEVESLQVTKREFVFRYRSAEHFVDIFRTYYGPMLKAFNALDSAKQESLANDLKALVQRFNRSDDRTMVVPADYLEVVAIR